MPLTGKNNNQPFTNQHVSDNILQMRIKFSHLQRMPEPIISSTTTMALLYTSSSPRYRRSHDRINIEEKERIHKMKLGTYHVVPIVECIRPDSFE